MLLLSIYFDVFDYVLLADELRPVDNHKENLYTAVCWYYISNRVLICFFFNSRLPVANMNTICRVLLNGKLPNCLMNRSCLVLYEKQLYHFFFLQIWTIASYDACFLHNSFIMFIYPSWGSSHPISDFLKVPPPIKFLSACTFDVARHKNSVKIHIYRCGEYGITRKITFLYIHHLYA